MTPDVSPDWPQRPRRRRRWPLLLGVMGVAALTAVAAGAALFGPPRQERHLAKALTKALPGTVVSSVDCKAAAAPRGFCEFLVGRNVFYATPDGRFVIVGQVLDLAKRIDLTERRRAEIVGLASATDQIAGAGPAAPPAAAAPRPDAPSILKVDLPLANAIVHHRGAPLKLTAFTDFNCHFCRQLFEGLADAKDVEVTEYPIAILGDDSVSKARAALCAADRDAAAAALYRGDPAAKRLDCPEGARRLQENQAFAQAHGIRGTPMIVRADGTTNAGWMPTPQLVAWLRQAATSVGSSGR